MGPQETDSHAANMLMVVEGLLVWMTYLALAFGKPLLFSTAQASWSRFLAAPNYTVAMGFFDSAVGAYRLLAAEFSRLFGTWALTSAALGDAASNLDQPGLLRACGGPPLVRRPPAPAGVLLVRAGGARLSALLPLEQRAACSRTRASR